MTDERDRRRIPHRDHAGRAATPATGIRTVTPPPYGVASGEVDSDDARMAEHFEDDTPVEVLMKGMKRIERKLDAPSVEVDASAFDAGDSWEWKRAMEARVTAAESLAAKADRRWYWPMRIAAGIATLATAAFAFVLTETRASGYKARDAELYRAQVDRNSSAIEALKETVAEIKGELRARLPFRTLPVSGPRNDPDKEPRQ